MPVESLQRFHSIHIGKLVIALVPATKEEDLWRKQ